MTAVALTVAGIAIAAVSFLALTYWLVCYFTRDTGTHAAPRGQREDWDEPDPGDWLPAPDWPAPEVAHDEDWQAALTGWHKALDEREAALAERLSGVIVADIYHATPVTQPGDYGWREPFAAWESDTFVGGMAAITDGSK